MQKIFVLYTGGTIGMKSTPSGLLPDTELAESALRPYSSQATFHWHICQPLIDSSNLTPAHWAEWLAIIQAALPAHDGILVLHGTDTLAYTANLLALALDNQAKPIVLTGSQKPYHAPHSDAPANLRTAVAALQNPQLHSTVIAFDGRLYPAIGSSKYSTERDDGFDNPHFGTWQPGQAQPHSLLSPLSAQFQPQARVCSHLLTPGSSAEQIAHSLRHFPQQAAILLGYGQGHAPESPELLHAIQHFTQHGGLLLNLSQAHHGRTGTDYAQGNALRQAGAVGGGKCNIETATALMTLAAGNRWTAGQLQQALQQLGLA
ncbi:L-asparaginase [Eikenella longinqua]|uniref:L-asparaginase n=1 Tax=Eikenella longinqua TaxID=1795827 RepID=A0A1A9RYA3_9NEIS|nr:asparaginase [Eikenella longinqua]OAM29163.1 L-asparaginase [Eikenella longinqua]